MALLNLSLLSLSGAGTGLIVPVFFQMSRGNYKLFFTIDSNRMNDYNVLQSQQNGKYALRHYFVKSTSSERSNYA
jgi:hypothetical protein